MKNRPHFWQRKGFFTANQTWNWIKRAFPWGFGWCLFGLLTVLAVAYVEVVRHPESRLAKVGIEFFKHIGVALLVLGVVGIILDFRHWREYFEERLQEIVMKRSYLMTLDKPELISLQTKTLTAYFRNENIDREDSFLHHFHSSIRDFIGSPYREDTRNSMIMYLTDGDDGYLVDDHLSYTCRKGGECIQPKVKWSLDLEDIIEFKSVKFTLTIPTSVYQAPSFADKYPEIKKRKLIIEQDHLIHIKGSETYEYKLDKFSDIDELQVSIEAQYVIKKDSLFSWALSLPSKGLSLTIKYPPRMEVAVQTFGMDEEELDKDAKDELYSIRYKSWILPGSGIAFQLRPKSSKVEKEAGTQQESIFRPIQKAGKEPDQKP